MLHDDIQILSFPNLVGIWEWDLALDRRLMFSDNGTVIIRLDGEKPHQVSMRGFIHAITEFYTCIRKNSIGIRVFPQN